MLHKRFDFTQQGGFPLTQDVLDFLQSATNDLSGVIAAVIGDNTILSGIQPNGTGGYTNWLGCY